MDTSTVESKIVQNGRNWELVSIQKPFLCPICFYGFRTVKQCSKIQHAICQECYNQWQKKTNTKTDLNGRKCTICMDPLIPAGHIRDRSNKDLVDLANEHEVKCLEDNCGWKGTHSEIDDHVKICIPSLHSCTFLKYGCNERNTISDLELHQLKCDYREEECPDKCGEKYSIINKKNHKRTCTEVAETYAITMKRKDWLAFSATSQGQTSSSSSSTKEATESHLKDIYPELAKAVQTRKAINTTCPYQCGTLIQNDLSHHIKICPEITISCRYSCSAAIKRKERATHYATCLDYPLPCPRECGLEVVRRQIQNKSHDDSCPKMPVACDYCQTQVERQNHATHELACRLPPFLLAGIEYKPQEGAIGNVYQRSSESKEYCTHVCMPIQTNELIQSLQIGGNPQVIRKRLGISEERNKRFKGLLFTIASENCEVRFTNTTEKRKATTKIRTDMDVLNISVVNSNGIKLCSLFNTHRDGHCYNPSKVNEKSLPALNPNNNEQVYLFMSRQPFDKLKIPNTETKMKSRFSWW